MLTTDSVGHFGYSVAVDGPTLVIGDTGTASAHIYRYNGYKWQWVQSLAPGVSLSDFAERVTVSGDVIAVSADYDDEVSIAAGAVYVYRYQPVSDQWVLETKLLGDGVIDHFGTSVVVSGDVLVVGTRTRGVEVYRYVGASWSLEQQIPTPQPNGGLAPAAAVDVDGTLLAVGVPYTGTSTQSDLDSLHILRKGSSWVEEALILPPGGIVLAQFGHSVAARESTVAVGAPYEDDPVDDAGAVYIFEYDGQNWNEQARIAAQSPSALDRFGLDVSLTGGSSSLGDLLLVGGRGSVWVFARTGGVWAQQQVLTPPAGYDDEFYGNAVFIDGATAVVGSKNALSDQGAAYVYVSEDSGPDCNLNDHADSCDIRAGTSEDFDDNGASDECDDCNSNGIADFVDVGNGTSIDCNGNFVPDECDIAKSRSPDCNDNGVPDECDVSTETSPDCNLNGSPDECDIVDGTSNDCSSDGVPDECDPDCNLNGVPDTCDVVVGTSNDCNGNATPDECEAPDCNENLSPDICDIASGASVDCNGDDIADECQADCNRNGIDDSCDLAGGTSSDCNGNGLVDECEASPFSVLSVEFKTFGYNIPMTRSFSARLANSPVTMTLKARGDLEATNEYVTVTLDGEPYGPFFVTAGHQCPLTPDVEQIQIPSTDFNTFASDGEIVVHAYASAGVDPGSCYGMSFLIIEIVFQEYGTSDCNSNDLPDECDIASGQSSDDNANGVPDECEAGITTAARYIDVRLPGGANPVAIRVLGDRADPAVSCVSSYVQGDGTLGPVSVFRTPDQWGFVEIHGAQIVSATDYSVQLDDGMTLFAPISVTTAQWGDVAGNFIDGAWEPPDGTVKVLDAVAALGRFQGQTSAPSVTYCDMQPRDPDGSITISDIVQILNAFAGAAYPFAPPCGG